MSELEQWREAVVDLPRVYGLPVQGRPVCWWRMGSVAVALVVPVVVLVALAMVAPLGGLLGVGVWTGALADLAKALVVASVFGGVLTPCLVDLVAERLA